jgi:hypothetical protein
MIFEAVTFQEVPHSKDLHETKFPEEPLTP